MAKLTDTMTEYIDAISAEWGPSPAHHSITSMTLGALEKRGLAECRVVRSPEGWRQVEVRLTAAGAVIKAERDEKRAKWKAQIAEIIGHD